MTYVRCTDCQAIKDAGALPTEWIPGTDKCRPYCPLCACEVFTDVLEPVCNYCEMELAVAKDDYCAHCQKVVDAIEQDDFERDYAAVVAAKPSDLHEELFNIAIPFRRAS